MIEGESRVKKKWYENTWLTFFFLWLFFPIGLFLMWRYSAWSSVVKWSVTGVIAALFVLLVVASAFTSDDDKDPKTSVSASTATSVRATTGRVSATARPSATPRPEATATNTQAVPTQPPLANRADCGAIRGTAYLSEEEHQWYLSNCSAPPPTQPPSGGGPGPQPTVAPPVSGNCDRQSYPDVCIAPYPPDLNCGDIPYTDFRVFPPDPHGFDGNNDGIGCIS